MRGSLQPTSRRWPFGGGRPRYWRDWLTAAASIIPLIGVAFPFYLAWRDDRRKWVRGCAVLVVAAAACFPLSDAGETIDTAAILTVWLGGITAGIVLASTVPPENRRASRAVR
jgi:multidrug transporter EmrE-like cation transporter